MKYLILITVTLVSFTVSSCKQQDECFCHTNMMCYTEEEMNEAIDAGQNIVCEDQP